MRTRARDASVLWWTIALLGAAGLAWAGLTGFAWNDYDSEAAPAFKALVGGDVHGFLRLLPAYGGSMVLRAPFAAITGALGGGELAVYRAVSLPGVLCGVILGMALVGRLRGRGVPLGTQALVLGLCAVNPVTLRALEIGHPEELMAATFAIGAVLAAGERRDVLAAVLLGLAMATKLWAVLAIGPVLLALPDRRVRTFLLASGLAAAVVAPILLSGSHQAIVDGAGKTGTIFQPWQVFWPLGDLSGPVYGADGQIKPGYRTPPGWLSTLTHPAIALLVIPLSALWWYRRSNVPAAPEQLLLLLALLLLLRCMLDPWNNVYYALPFLLALLAWESLCRSDRPPVLALLCTALVWITFEKAPGWVGPDAQSAIYLAWSLPLVAWMAHEAFVAKPVRASAFLRAPRRRGARGGEIQVRPGAHVS